MRGNDELQHADQHRSERSGFLCREISGFFAVGGNHDILPRWHGDNEIAIDVPRGEEVYRNEGHAGGIAIDCE